MAARQFLLGQLPIPAPPPPTDVKAYHIEPLQVLLPDRESETSTDSLIFYLAGVP